MKPQIDFQQVAVEHQQAANSVFAQAQQIQQAASLIITALQNGNKILWCGNGGSAAEAQHMAAELMVRYVKNRQPLASIALTTDTSILTAHPNDYQFESVFERQVQGLGKAGDVLIGMSTSGTSSNVLQAMQTAQKSDIKTIALVGQNSQAIQPLANLVLTVNADKTARIQEGHTLINHLICQILDEVFS